MADASWRRLNEEEGVAPAAQREGGVAGELELQFMSMLYAPVVHADMCAEFGTADGREACAEDDLAVSSYISIVPKEVEPSELLVEPMVGLKRTMRPLADRPEGCHEVSVFMGWLG